MDKSSFTFSTRAGSLISMYNEISIPEETNFFKEMICCKDLISCKEYSAVKNIQRNLVVDMFAEKELADDFTDRKPNRSPCFLFHMAGKPDPGGVCDGPQSL